MLKNDHLKCFFTGYKYEMNCTFENYSVVIENP